jgi:hypothetical protein
VATAVIPHPNEVALALTGRPYVSFSALNTFMTCPLRWYFRYVVGIPEETVSASLVPPSMRLVVWVTLTAFGRIVSLKCFSTWRELRQSWEAFL